MYMLENRLVGIRMKRGNVNNRDLPGADGQGDIPMKSTQQLDIFGASDAIVKWKQMPIFMSRFLRAHNHGDVLLWMK